MKLRLAVLLAFLALAVAFVFPIGTGAEPVAQPKIPHTLEGRDNCLACHGPGGLKPVPASHAGRSVATCRGCHQVASAGNAADPTVVPVPVSTPVEAPVTDLNSAGPTPEPVTTTSRPAVPATPTKKPVAAAVAAQPTPTATAPLPKTGDGDFIIVAAVAVVLIGLGIGMRRFAAAR